MARQVRQVAKSSTHIQNTTPDKIFDLGEITIYCHRLCTRSWQRLERAWRGTVGGVKAQREGRIGGLWDCGQYMALWAGREGRAALRRSIRQRAGSLDTLALRGLFQSARNVTSPRPGPLSQSLGQSFVRKVLVCSSLFGTALLFSFPFPFLSFILPFSLSFLLSFFLTHTNTGTRSLTIFHSRRHSFKLPCSDIFLLIIFTFSHLNTSYFFPHSR